MKYASLHTARCVRRLTALSMGCATLALGSAALADDHVHDGFYMHLGAGFGYYSTKATVGATDYSYSGVTAVSALFLGGSPVKGLAIAGGFFTDYAPSPTYEVNGTKATGVDIKQYVIGIGPLVDVYPDPTKGLHFQGFFGWGGLETSANGNVGGSDPTGLVTFVGGGYDWWVGNEWSIGVLGRFVYAPLKYQDVSFTTIAPAILATFTYH